MLSIIYMYCFEKNSNNLSRDGFLEEDYGTDNLPEI